MEPNPLLSRLQLQASISLVRVWPFWCLERKKRKKERKTNCSIDWWEVRKSRIGINTRCCTSQLLLIREWFLFCSCDDVLSSEVSWPSGLEVDDARSCLLLYASLHRRRGEKQPADSAVGESIKNFNEKKKKETESLRRKHFIVKIIRL